MFKCQIVYDCELKNHTNTLAIFKDGEIVSQCTMRKVAATGKEKTKLEITCNLITGYAGKDWKFVLGSKSGVNPTIGNETFIITLDPLLLTKLPSFDITLDEEITSASIFIPDCSHISETKYLNFQCSSDDDVKKLVTDACQVTCPVKSDSTYNISLIRLPIPIYNGKEIVNATFSEERRRETIRIGKPCHNAHSTAMRIMNRTSSIFTLNISYNCLMTNSAKLAVFKDDNIVTQCKIGLTYLPKIEKTNVLVTCANIINHAGQKWTFSFGGMNDHKTNVVNETFTVSLEPFSLRSLPKVQPTVDENITLATIVVEGCNGVAEIAHLYFQCGLGVTGRQSLPENCTFTCSVQPAVNYHVQVIRSSIPKHDGAQTPNGIFPEEALPITFSTTLKPVLYKRAWLSNNTDISVEVIPQSDFNHIESVCQANHTQPSVCMDMKITHSQCTTTLISTFNGIPGCDYRCFFSTIKEDYIDVHSEEYTMSIPPPKPIITSTIWADHYIFVEWTIDEPAYVDQFLVVVNNKSMIVSDRDARSFNYTNNILPNQEYYLHVELMSNQIISSNTIYDKTANVACQLDPREKKDRSLLWLISIPIAIIFLLGVGCIVWKRKTLQKRQSTSRKSRPGDSQAKDTE
ncbi:unnamed protein product [Adineta steineri]|uniref:Uncharacterized protein n=1 Tax=Adineta steineri TaxID=433720 RepID=A0A813TRF3_9BILA|nr:unnamed protein product [Adineta steineri]CAF3741823.1 unnamed protein product [Adineta steineri]